MSAPGSDARTVIDTHVHLWERDVVPQPWIDGGTMAAIDRDFPVAGLQAVLEQVGVAGAVAVQSAAVFAENAYLLDAAEASDELVGVVGWVDLRAGADGVRDQLAVLAEHPAAAALVGVRHPVHVDADRGWLLRDDLVPALAVLGNRGLAFDLVIRPWQLEQAAMLAERVPSVELVLDHLGKPPLAAGDLDDWHAGLARLAAQPNVVAKISGLTIEADWGAWTDADVARALEPALDLFGPDRLLFGSDWPLVRLTRGGYADWLDAYLRATAALSRDEQRAIDRGTAARIYGV